MTEETLAEKVARLKREAEALELLASDTELEKLVSAQADAEKAFDRAHQRAKQAAEVAADARTALDSARRAVQAKLVEHIRNGVPQATLAQAAGVSINAVSRAAALAHGEDTATTTPSGPQPDFPPADTTQHATPGY